MKNNLKFGYFVDLDEENILKTIQRNFDHNKPLVKATYKIQELNFFKPFQVDVANFVKQTEIVLVSESKCSVCYSFN